MGNPLRRQQPVNNEGRRQVDVITEVINWLKENHPTIQDADSAMGILIPWSQSADGGPYDLKIIKNQVDKAYPTLINKPNLSDQYHNHPYFLGIQHIIKDYVEQGLKEGSGVQIHPPVESVRSNMIQLVPYGEQWTAVVDRLRSDKFKQYLVIRGQLPEETEVLIGRGHILVQIPKDDWYPIPCIRFSFLKDKNGKPRLQNSWEYPIINLGVIDSQPFQMDISGIPRVYSALELSLMHMLIGSGTGGGKTNLMELIVYQLHRRYQHGLINIAIIDLEGNDLAVFNNSSILMGGTIIDNIDDAVTLMRGIDSERKRRKHQFDMAIREYNADIRDISDYNRCALTNKFEPLPWNVILISEAATPLSDRTFESLVESGVRLDRKYGQIYILETQRPSFEVVSSEIKANCKIKIALKTQTVGDSKVILGGNDDRGYRLNGKGHAIVIADGVDERIQTYQVPRGASKELVDNYNDAIQRKGLNPYPPTFPDILTFNTPPIFVGNPLQQDNNHEISLHDLWSDG